MSKGQRSRIAGEPVTYRLPVPAGGVQLEIFVPWTLVKRGAKRAVITPLDAPEAFGDEARQERRTQASVQHTALLRAPGLAHHWQRLLRLVLLAPEVVKWLFSAPEATLEQVMGGSWPLS